MPTITTFQCSDDIRVINKTLTNNVDYECEILDSMNVINPQLRLFCTSTTFNNNYAYIPFLGRYYRITDFSVESAETIIINTEIDVLYTYKTALLDSTFLVTRNENIGSTYIPDSHLPLYPYKEMKVIEFSDSEFNLNTATVNNYNYVLNVAGGGSGQQAESEVINES